MVHGEQKTPKARVVRMGHAVPTEREVRRRCWDCEAQREGLCLTTHVESRLFLLPLNALHHHRLWLHCALRCVLL